MIKNKILLTLLSFYSIVGMSQTKLPGSHVNVGAGVGMNYGGIGIKTVLGIRNSGLLIGLGAMPYGVVGYKIGVQISEDWFYINIGYGVNGSVKHYDGSVRAMMAWNFLVGGMINLGKGNRSFIDLGAGHTFAATPIDVGPFGALDNNIGPTFVAGFGYRFGGKE